MNYKPTSQQMISDTQNHTYCDGLNCYNFPVKTISVMAGTFGKIDLKLCATCISIFNLKEMGNERENQLKGVSKSDVLFN